LDNIAGALFSGTLLGRVSNRDAILCEGRRISYGELADLVIRTGHALREQGLRTGERVVFRLRDTELLVGGLFGAMYGGLVPVILALHASDDDLRYVIEDTGAALVVDEDDRANADARPLPITRMGAGEFARLQQSPVPAGGFAPVSGGREAFWLFSSGTTGRMKGVVHAHHDLAPVTAYHRNALNMGPGTRIFCTSRLSFAYAIGNACLAPLAVGATMVMQPDWPTPENSLETIEATRPEVVFSVPTLYRHWLELPAGQLEPMRRVGRFVSAGEALPPSIAERWTALTGRPIFDCYGCSETVFFIFATPPERPKPGSVGFPCAEVETRLCDENDQPVAPGETGRLLIRHPFLALGYGPAAAHAQKRFRDGWFATGDVFRRDDGGYWRHSGREDDWLKIAGRWMSIKDLEETAGGFDGVAEAVAVAARDADGFMRVALFAVLGDGEEHETFVTRIGGFLDGRLPHYKQPKWIRVVDELPRTATGKVRKAELRKMIEEQPA
jgi:benzoate-CoA ligase